MLTYYVIEDLLNEDTQDAAPFTLLDRAIRAYRLLLNNRTKALRVCKEAGYIDLVQCLPVTPRDPVGRDTMLLDFLDQPGWRSDRAVMLAARTLADKLHIRYCLFRGCLLPAPVMDKLPRNLEDKRLWPSVQGRPETAVRWIEVAGAGRLSPSEFRRRYLTGTSSASLTPPLVLRLTVFLQHGNGRCKTHKLLPWEFHLLARAGSENS